MLRLFSSFLHSGPQLVFHFLLSSHTTCTELHITWTLVSEVSTTVYLGWGVAAYCQALRLVRVERINMSWLGLILHTTWRAAMLSARVVSLVLTCLALGQWAVIVICKY